jgi:hypothetical protein
LSIELQTARRRAKGSLLDLMTALCASGASEAAKVLVLEVTHVGPKKETGVISGVMTKKTLTSSPDRAHAAVRQVSIAAACRRGVLVIPPALTAE